MDNMWDAPDGSYTASPTLREDDPLREWAKNLSPDDLKALAADPQKAIDDLASRGVPPPPPHIMAYSDPMGNETGGDSPSFPVFNKGKLQGNLTSNQGAVPAPSADTTKPVVPEHSVPATPTGTSDSPFDPSDNVALPRERPKEAGPDAATLKQQKKDKVSDALSGFSDSLKGVKAPTAPPLNAVGTPGAPQHTSMTAPNITQLLSLIGQQSHPSALSTLGRLLVAGKA